MYVYIGLQSKSRKTKTTTYLGRALYAYNFEPISRCENQFFNTLDFIFEHLPILKQLHAFQLMLRWVHIMILRKELSLCHKL